MRQTGGLRTALVAVHFVVLAAIGLIGCSGGGGKSGNEVVSADFSVVGTITGSVAPGAGGVVNLAATRSGGHSAAISVTVENYAQGITGVGTIAAGANAGTLTLTVPSSVPEGNYALNLQASDGKLTRNSVFSVAVSSGQALADFTASVGGSVTVKAGDAGGVGITIARLNGHSKAIQASVQTNPQGITGSGAVAASSTTGTVQVSVPAGVAAGTYSLSVGFSDGTITRSASLTVVVTAVAGADYSVAVAAASVQAGGTGSAAVTVSRGGGHTKSITVAVATNGQGITGSGTVATGATTGSLSLVVPASVVPGSYTLSVNATDGSITKTGSLAVTVTATATPGFSIAMTAPAAIPAGGLSNTGLTVARTGGHTAALNLTVGTNTNGITGSGFVPEGGSGGMFSYAVPTALAAGTYPVVVSATDGTLVRTVSVALAVQAPTPTVVISPERAVVAPGGSQTFVPSLVGIAASDLAWSVLDAGGGSITGGAYQAPSTAGSYMVKAASKTYPGVAGYALVTVANSSTVTVDATLLPGGSKAGFSLTSSIETVDAAKTSALRCSARDIVTLQKGGQPYLMAMAFPAAAPKVLDASTTAVAFLLSHPMVGTSDPTALQAMALKLPSHASFPALVNGLKQNLRSGLTAPLSPMATARLEPLAETILKAMQPSVVAARVVSAASARQAATAAFAGSGLDIPGSNGRMSLTVDGDALSFANRYSIYYVAYSMDPSRHEVISPREGWMGVTVDWLHLDYTIKEGETVTGIQASDIGLGRKGYQVLNLVKGEPGVWDWDTAAGRANWMNVLGVVKVAGQDILPNLVVSGKKIGKTAKFIRAIQTVSKKIDDHKKGAKALLYSLDAGLSIMLAIDESYPEFVTDPDKRAMWESYLEMTRSYLARASAVLAALPDGPEAGGPNGRIGKKKYFADQLISAFGGKFIDDGIDKSVDDQVRNALDHYLRVNPTGKDPLEVIKTVVLSELEEAAALGGVDPKVLVEGPKSLEQAVDAASALGMLLAKQDDFWNGLIDMGVAASADAVAKTNIVLSKVLFTAKATYSVANSLLPYVGDMFEAPAHLRVNFRDGVPVFAQIPADLSVEIKNETTNAVLYTGPMVVAKPPTLTIKRGDSLRVRFRAYTSGVNGDLEYGTDLVHDKVENTFLSYKPKTLVHQFTVSSIYAASIGAGGGLGWRSTLFVEKVDAIKPFVYSHDIWTTQSDPVNQYVDPGNEKYGVPVLPAGLGGPVAGTTGGWNHLDITTAALVVGNPLRGLRLHFDNYGFSGGVDAVFPVVMTGNVAPVASFIGTIAGDAITLDPAGSADPDGKILSYRWAFGDGTYTTMTTAAPVVNRYLGGGTFTVTLTVMDDNGVVGSASKTFTVPKTPTVNAFVAVPSSISAGESSTLEWRVSGATKVEIDNGVGAVTGLIGKSVSPSVTTKYTLTATNANGTVSKTVTVTVAPVIPAASWAKTFGNGNGQQQTIEAKFSAAALPDGGYLAAGSNSVYGQLAGVAPMGWLTNYDVNGFVRWSKTYSWGANYMRFSRVVALGDGGSLVAGYTNQVSGGASGGVRLVLARLDSTGGVVWAKGYGSADAHIVPERLIVTGVDANWLLGSVAGIPCLMKVDGNGNVASFRAMSVDGGKTYESGALLSAIPSGDGGLYVGGVVHRTVSNPYPLGGSGERPFVGKVDSGGALVWHSVVKGVYSMVGMDDSSVTAEFAKPMHVFPSEGGFGCIVPTDRGAFTILKFESDGVLSQESGYSGRNYWSGVAGVAPAKDGTLWGVLRGALEDTGVFQLDATGAVKTQRFLPGVTLLFSDIAMLADGKTPQVVGTNSVDISGGSFNTEAFLVRPASTGDFPLVVARQIKNELTGPTPGSSAVALNMKLTMEAQTGVPLEPITVKGTAVSPVLQTWVD